MAGEFEGRIAIVTGAAGGVGSAVVRRLGEAGAGIVAVDLAPSVRELEADAILAVEGDASLTATAERAVAAALDRWGVSTCSSTTPVTSSTRPSSTRATRNGTACSP